MCVSFCLVLWFSALHHFMSNTTSFSFCFLCSAALATPLLTKQRQGTGPRSLFWLLREFVGVLCGIILGFPNQHPPSQFSARIHGTVWVSCCSWLMGLIWKGEEFLAVWIVLCKTASPQTCFICWAIALEACFFDSAACGRQVSTAFVESPSLGRCRKSAVSVFSPPVCLTQGNSGFFQLCPRKKQTSQPILSV